MTGSKKPASVSRFVLLNSIWNSSHYGENAGVAHIWPAKMWPVVNDDYANE